MSNQNLFPILRRLIGRRFDDATVKKDIETWPFKVVDDGGNPKIEVTYLGETKQFSAQEISSMVLLKVRISELAATFWLFGSHYNCLRPGLTSQLDERSCRSETWQEG